MLFQTALVTFVLAVLVTAVPTILSRGDSDLVSFCFADGSCFDASAIPEGCVDLPLFSQDFKTASLSTTGGIECILSEARGCPGTSVLFGSAGTVDLSSALGLSTVGSFICTSDVDTINLCWPSDVQNCFQGSTVTDGCSNTPRFSTAFSSVSLTTAGTQCTLFEDPDCSGSSAVVAEPTSSVELAPLGLSNVQSFSCVNH
ncbi:hypothetical protein B0H15DRAFT_855313 [Mycena belliarum]|uniref:Uncharacterized protein n=1 Tax=Mycena belliarum TaxID=1033014 RepID=A0AAD6TVL1_9AGAR|nr:hypothetical protein B0H15DRAFT_855313 [Mycena belliae]